MWAIMRILDKVQPGLQPLANSSGLIQEGSDAPGYPELVADAIKEVEGVDDPIGHLAPKPPLSSVNNPREPTDVERQAFGDDIVPGAPYADPCTDPEPERILEYTIAVMKPGNPNGIVYNDVGDHDPEGLAYVLDRVRVKAPDGTVQKDVDVDDAELLREGKLNPEPLFIRANVGDCVEVRLQNELVEEEFHTSVHPHFVGFDQLGSESVTTGFNYEQSTDPGDTMQYRWYADEEGAIFFHDHIVGVSEGMHGLFCGLLVEPERSEWTDPYSGERIFSGAQAVIDPPEADAFREQALHYHDFAQLRDPDTGEFVNPDREHNQNAGTNAINYRNSPFYHRDDEDPAYVHSSQVHGDPETPILEAYEGDKIRFRLFQGSWEEQHNFDLSGLRFDPEGFADQDMVSQVIGTSEAFTFTVRPEESQQDFKHITNPDDLPVRDYRYGSNVIDDMWTGMWGLSRIWGPRSTTSKHSPARPRRASPSPRPNSRRWVIRHPSPTSTGPRKASERNSAMQRART